MNKLQIISVFTKIMELLSIAASYKIIFPNKTIDLQLWLLKLIKVFNMFLKIILVFLARFLGITSMKKNKPVKIAPTKSSSQIPTKKHKKISPKYPKG